MHGLKFLGSWTAFGIPSSLIAIGLGCAFHWSIAATVAVVVTVEVVTVLSGVFCVTTKEADERMHALFEKEMERKRS